MQATRLSLALALIAGAATAAPPAVSLSLTPLASYQGSGGGDSGAEIVAFDPTTRRAFAINAGGNTVDVIGLADPASPVRLAVLDFAPYGGGVNSVAVHEGLVAVAAEAADKTEPGQVVFLDAASLEVLKQVTAGALPDMLTFTPDGEYLLVANEGEPNDAYTVDPEGTVSVIDLRNGVADATARHADFTLWIGQEAALRNQGVRIYGPGANAAQDFEPEYIVVSGPRAWVSLQENNAVAVLNIGQARFERIIPLGYKDHSLAGNGLDPSDRDNANAIAPWPVLGMFQPDGMALFRVRNEVFLLTANEGDARVYPPGDTVIDGVPVDEGDIFNEEVRVGSGSYVLDPTAFPDAATLKDNTRLGRLTVTRRLGDTDGDGDFDRIHAFGARSLSLWDVKALGDGPALTAPNAGLVWDSGDQLEQLTAALYPDQFNASNSNDERDNRSDNKGPEPEGVVVGRVGPRQYAFVGLERIGGVAVYDVSEPRSPAFVQYVNTRAFGLDALPGQDDSGPEGLTFIPAEESPNGQALLLVGNEVTQTVAIFTVGL